MDPGTRNAVVIDTCTTCRKVESRRVPAVFKANWLNPVHEGGAALGLRKWIRYRLWEMGIYDWPI